MRGQTRDLNLPVFLQNIENLFLPEVGQSAMCSGSLARLSYVRL